MPIKKGQALYKGGISESRKGVIAKRKDNLLLCLEKHLGVVTPACKELGIATNSFYLWYNKDPDFKQRVDEIRESTVDFVETAMFKKIKTGEPSLIKFYLTTQGKNRGYGEDSGKTTFNVSVSIDGMDDNDEPVQINITPSLDENKNNKLNGQSE